MAYKTARRDARAKKLLRTYTNFHKERTRWQKKRSMLLLPMKKAFKFFPSDSETSGSAGMSFTDGSIESFDLGVNLRHLEVDSDDEEVSELDYVSDSDSDWSLGQKLHEQSDSDSQESRHRSYKLGSFSGDGESSDYESDLEGGLLADDKESLFGQHDGFWEAEQGDADSGHGGWRASSQNRLHKWVQNQLHDMYSHRYKMPRKNMTRGPSYLHHVLMALKNSQEDHFREELRVSPTTFDKMVEHLSPDQIFSNNSEKSQMPVEEQLAIVLFRFGHDGNAASLQKVANWAGIGKGTMSLVTSRVMWAVLRADFMDEAVCFPTPEEKEEAKIWVEKCSQCKAWRDGWCLVDGTLVPLFEQPTWFGTSFFDRKCQYSLNFQIVSLQNLQIINFALGHVGSTHHATAWEDTKLCLQSDIHMEDGEWVWADSAYPINTWIVAPYKKPERDIPDNEEFNTSVSRVRICSEHAIGFLKGRFQSLKRLRIKINCKRRYQFAMYWVSACIALHSFAMKCESRERDQEKEDDSWQQRIIEEGLESDDESDNERRPAAPSPAVPVSASQLAAAKAWREKLKRKLFRARDKRREQSVSY